MKALVRIFNERRIRKANASTLTAGVAGKGSNCESASAIKRTRDRRSSLIAEHRSNWLASSNRCRRPLTKLSADQSNPRDLARFGLVGAVAQGRVRAER